MPSFEREGSRDRAIKHQHSSSESGRASVPMWDSSDPDRAPPPLPMNPSYPGGSPTRADSSAKIAAAAQALLERARQNAGVQPLAITTPERSPERSPERTPAKTPQHKRLQSLQNGSPKDTKLTLEDKGSSDRNSLPATPTRGLAPVDDQQDTPTPVASSKDASKDSMQRSSSRSNRSSFRPVLAENTPPSATAQSGHNTPFRDVESPLADVTNSSAPRTSFSSIETVSSEVRHITSMMLNLQKDMNALSRRSKDNAADLLALKESTKTRGEEVKKSLRELIHHHKVAESSYAGSIRTDISRPVSALGQCPPSLDLRSHVSPSLTKSISLPKIPPALSFDPSVDYDRGACPSPFSIDSAASVAMLEKIIRQMVTKEGQERLLSTLTDMLEKSREESSGTAKKVQELLEVVRRDRLERTDIVKRRPDSAFSDKRSEYEQDGAMIESRARGLDLSNKPEAASFVNDEFMKLLHRMKDSIAENGGFTNEVKHVIQDLRGEVLGQGRDIGRKLESLNVVKARNNNDALQDSHDEIRQIVEDGLEQLRDQMERIVRDNRRQSTSSLTSRNTVDSSEVHAVVKHALAERGLDQSSALQSPAAAFDQQAILEAVKEAYEAYKPEIELQQFGLERDEILQCLREGLEDYQSNREPSPSTQISREEIIAAVQEAMQGFVPPRTSTEAVELKEEVLATVQECLDNFRPPTQGRSAWNAADMTREDVMAAVREELGAFKKEGTRQIEISREDLFHAVKAGLDNTQTPFGGYGDQVLQSLYNILESMRDEFKEYSAANGRDTEQVLDAVKDGLETLRAQIEAYVDEAKDPNNVQELQSMLQAGMHDLKSQVNRSLAEIDNVSTRNDLVDFIKAEFERVHVAVAMQPAPAVNREEVGEVLREQLEQLQTELLNSSAIHKEELLDAVQESLNNLHTKLEYRSVGPSVDTESLDAVKRELRELHETIAKLPAQGDQSSRTEIANALRESLNAIRVQLAADQSDAASESLGALREEMENLREGLTTSMVPAPPKLDKDELLQTIRDGLAELNTEHARSTDQSSSDVNLSEIKAELESLRQSISTAMVPGSSSPAGTEDLVATIRVGLEEIRSQVNGSFETLGTSSGALDGKFDQMLDNFTALRKEVANMSTKSASDDVANVLKTGLADLRKDMQRLRAGDTAYKNRDVVLADESAGVSSRDFAPGNKTTEHKNNELEKVEVLLAQLQIKVEAMDQNISSGAPTFQRQEQTSAANIDLSRIDSMLQTIQSSIDSLPQRSATGPGCSVTREDMDALETLLQNTKAKLDDRILPELESLATKDHIASLETVLRITGESFDGLSSRVDEKMAGAKSDVEALALMLEESSSTLDELKERASQISKSDFEALQSACFEIKDNLEKFPGLIEDFRKAYEHDLDVTAKSLDNNREQTKEIADQITVLKSLSLESRDEVKGGLDQTVESVQALGLMLEGIETKIDESPNIIESVKEAIKQELDRANNSIEEIKTHQTAGTDTILERTDQNRDSLVADIVSKLENQFGDILSRQEIQQQATEHMVHTFEEKSGQQESVLTESKTVVEDLKLTIDTLGTSVTAIAPALDAATNKMSDDAKTVFDKMEEVCSKSDYNHEENKVEHQLTRDEVVRAVGEVAMLHETVGGFEPKFMDALSSLAAMVTEHFEHSKRFQEFSSEHFETSKRFQEFSQEQAQKSTEQFQDIKSSVEALPVPRLEGPTSRSAETETGDAVRITDKLDEVLRIVSASGTSSASDTLDKQSILAKLEELSSKLNENEESNASSTKVQEMHQQVMETAAEISAFVSFQQKMITAQHENREEEAKQAAAELSQYRADAQAIEATLSSLEETKSGLTSDIESLRQDVASLRKEQETLRTQKTRLSSDVASLETALQIRREELQEIDSRAVAIEKRMMDRAIDHTRSVLMSKGSRPAPPNMSLKRVSSIASNASAATTTPTNAASSRLGVAAKAPTPTKRTPGSANPSTRRILSLNQITSNVPGGARSSVNAPRNSSTGIDSLKRSQTVRQPTTRKSSWVPQSPHEELDKENTVFSDRSEEEAEEAIQAPTISRSVSYAGTNRTRSDRQTSFGTTGSEYSYSTGSYLTGTESDRRASVGSTIRSTLGAGTSLEDSIHEDDEEDDAEVEEEGEQKLLEAPVHETEQLLLEGVQEKNLIIAPSAHGNDSGLGSELPTATYSTKTVDDYFDGVTAVAVAGDE